MTEMRFNIIAVTGFARPTCLLINTASLFQSSIHLEYKGRSVSLKNSPTSIMDVMSLEIKPGTAFKIWADGVDEHQAIKAIEKALIETWRIS
ncbi:HPr family phosphocarrier protein [Niallia taxi]|nr:HPr family phosphocarrier protein [Niallia taxi]MDK8640516.1 HPr family phosphocarrier protein [Niallia taxi]MED4035980.1 HPr family phosphocarrier protein [Niallia taxi]MED4057334.1 HPr family phosphocarrier protein [Niallia taxi]MED4118829.1 HPr family phosphocarrier protein [Niallia taxi]